MGERGYHLFVNEYNGEPKVHIRKIYMNPNDGMPIITKYGITLSGDEWNALKQYIRPTNHQLMNLSRQASMTKVPAVPGPAAKVKSQRTAPYQRKPTITNKQMKYIDSARNVDNTMTEDAVPNTIDELFNTTLQNY